MVNEWLMITNPGVAPVEGFLLMGASDKDAEDPNTIGMFGSGIKYSIAQLGRVGRLPRIYLGNTLIEFGLGEIQVRAKAHQEIRYRINGGAWKSYGSVIQMGEKDWGDLWMAIREFVSNALDEVGGNPAGIQIGIVDKPRAKGGETRVYIPWMIRGKNGEGAEEHLQKGLGAMFLHFRPGGNILRQTYGPIEKTAPGPPKFFRRGVLVRQWAGEGEQAKPSMFDYNFKDLKVDEARNASDWDLMYKAGGLITADPKVFADILMKLGDRGLLGQEGLWEGKILNEYALTSYNGEIRQGIVAELQARLGDRGVLAASPQSAEIARNRGLVPVIVPIAWAGAVETMGGPTVGTVVGEMAKKGWEPEELREEVMRKCREWCGRVERWGLTGDKPRPEFAGFRQHPGQGMVRGQYVGKTKTVQLNVEMGGEELDLTILEELCHHYSGNADFTRGFQEWLLRAVMRGIQGEGRKE